MDPIYLVIAAGLLLGVVIGLVVARRRTLEDDTVAIPEDRADVRRRPPSQLASALRRAWQRGLGDDAWDAIEEALLAADLGLDGTAAVISRARATSPTSVDEAKSALHAALLDELSGSDRQMHLDGSPAIILVVGVNGTGKTTTVAKLARWLARSGTSSVLAAADTFRAAAGEQLRTWGDRVGSRVVSGDEGADPASVAHDALSAARAGEAGAVIIDTAGRLHGKGNLMAELAKIHRVAGGDDIDEVLLVLDATAGQNGLIQVREFSKSVPLTGIVLTKFDGTARGGIVVAVERELGVPVKFVGVGESLDDLQTFEPTEFVDGLLEGS